MKRIAIGSLRYRVQIEAPVRAPSSGGGATINWIEVATVWGSFAPVSGREAVIGNTLVGRSLHDVTIRYRDDINPSMRFVIDGRQLDIKVIADLDGRHQWLICQCEERLP